MNIPRFFVSQPITEPKITINDTNLIHQISKVFRMKTGDSVTLLDNTGYMFHVKISNINKNEISFSVSKKEKLEWKPKKDLCLFFSIIKKDNVEWVIQKCTEIGVNYFFPILSERSEKKNINNERINKIIKEASEQSGRTIMPELKEIKTLNEILDIKLKLIALDPCGQKISEKNIPWKEDSSLGVLVGPEGGFSEKELSLIKEKGVKIFSLGTQILRAETANVAIASLILLS